MVWIFSRTTTPKATAVVWEEPPAFSLMDNPAIASDSRDLWLSYLCNDQKESYALLRFSHVIDHRLSPINDEGLGKHPYASAGLKFYEFHEIMNSQETAKWAALKARHWVVTFKDVTLDVLAQECQIVVRSVTARSALAAITNHLTTLQ